MGFEPSQWRSHVESINEFKECMQDALEEAMAALAKSKDDMAKYYDWKQTLAPDYKPGDKVYLDAPTVKHGGGNNFMVWGCMGWNGMGKLIEVEGKMDAAKYCEILEDGLVKSFETLEIEEGEHYF